MATFDSILTPASAHGVQINDLANSTASSSQDTGKNTKFAIVTTGAVTIAFGATATAASFLIPANTVLTFDTGEQYTSFTVFNVSGSAADIHWLRLSHF